MRTSWKTWIVALAAAVVGGILTVPTAVSAAGPLSNPSAEHDFGCTGAKATIQVTWIASDEVSVHWRLEDTTSAYGRHPVLRIAAQGPSGTAPYIFGNGHAYYVLEGGMGSSHSGIKLGWNPSDVTVVNHLRVSVQNGTSQQEVDCQITKNIYNWSKMAYGLAKNKIGAEYVRGTEGPDTYDCSGLVYASYNPITNSPGWPVRTADAMFDWARTHDDGGKFYAKRITSAADLQFGDLIFFNFDDGSDTYAGHVGFHAGDGKILDAEGPARSDGVSIRSQGLGSAVGMFRIIGIATV
ncbi:NlpC/P60 family protein [Phytomonospora sp. NPDC050363]|uniref:C40 family peptidase n=1 Tax=Phytomonospora sp. NPDC050363 TaxID=3155642 RepID=UPI0033C6527C